MGLNNPIRIGITDAEIRLEDFGVDFETMVVRPSEGNIYLYWEEDDA